MMIHGLHEGMALIGLSDRAWSYESLLEHVNAFSPNDEVFIGVGKKGGKVRSARFSRFLDNDY